MMAETVGDRLQGLSVYLVGMMGAGKTTVSQALAQALGYQPLDTDQVVEQVAQRAINEIFAEDGEDQFRDLETQVLQEISTYKRLVVATGGGIVLRPTNWSYLRNGLVIWLDVSVPILVDRLAQDQSRPLLCQENLTEKLTSLLEVRTPLYRLADLSIAINTPETPSQICDRILAAIPAIYKKPATPPEPGSKEPPFHGEV